MAKSKKAVALEAEAPAEVSISDADLIAIVGEKLVALLKRLGLVDKAIEAYERLIKNMPPGSVPNAAQVNSILSDLLQPSVVAALGEMAKDVLVLFMTGRSKVKRGKTAHA